MIMYYSKTTGGFYSFDIHGSTMPSDCVEIDDATYRSLLAGQSTGKQIVADQDGNPILTALVPDPQVILTAKTTQLRTVREGILNRLSGIALAAQLTGDTATTAAYITVRQGLLDITENLPLDETIDGVVMYRYAALVGACTPQMVTAFAQVDA